VPEPWRPVQCARRIRLRKDRDTNGVAKPGLGTCAHPHRDSGWELQPSEDCYPGQYPRYKIPRTARCAGCPGNGGANHPNANRRRKLSLEAHYRRSARKTPRQWQQSAPPFGSVRNRFRWFATNREAVRLLAARQRRPSDCCAQYRGAHGIKPVPRAVHIPTRFPHSCYL
jgi:hypothetical protein